MFTSIYNVLAKWSSDLIAWFMGCVYSFAEALLVPLLDMIPDVTGIDISPIIQYGTWANHWIALDFGFTLLGLWFAITGTLIITNWILGLVPTIN